MADKSRDKSADNSANANDNSNNLGQKAIVISPSAEFLSIREVIVKTGLSRSSIYRMAASGDFPAAYKLSVRRVAWRRADVEEWISSREQNKDAPAVFGSHRGRAVVRRVVSKAQK